MAMGVYCVKCKHKELEPKFDKWPCMDCCDGDRSEPITNYDLLISKTPEELADFLVEHDFTVHGMLAKKKLILNWLKIPADKEGEG